MNTRLFTGRATLFILAFAALQTTSYGFDFIPLLDKVTQGKPERHNGVAPALNESSNGFSDCKSVFFAGKPPALVASNNTKTRQLCFDGFSTLYSSTHKIPVYSAEVLNKSRMTNSDRQERTNLFFEDARLPSAERATLQDYKGSKFDRGHNFPAGDTSTPESMAQSFSLANMMPQAPEHNRKLWSDYESATRKYVKRAQGDVYVITGSVVNPASCTIETGLSGERPRKYDLNKCTIGSGVAVPSHIYKVVFDPSAKKAWAYWTVNANNQKAGPPVSYTEIVKLTGLDFFPGASIK